MLAENLKNIRKEKGYSQERLAEESGLSLRTVQRIENNDSQPRGDTLIRLAEALDVKPDRLSKWRLKKDPSYLIGMNLSALSYLLFPLFGIILPLVLWLTKKNEVQKVNSYGKQLLNFQITWNLALFVFIILLSLWNHYILISMSVISISEISNSYFWITVILGGIYLYNFVVIVVNTVRINNGKKGWFYPRINVVK